MAITGEIQRPAEPATPPRARRRLRHWRGALTVLVVVVGLAVLAKVYGPRALIEYDLYRARQAMADAELERAMDWLQAVKGPQGERGDVHFLLGTLHRRSHAYGLARRHFAQAKALGYPSKLVAREELLMEFQMGFIKEAEPLMNGLLSRGGSDELAEDIYEALVVGYLTEFRAADALLVLNYWLEWRPDSIRGRLSQAYLYAVKSDWESYQRELRELLAIYPKRLDERLSLIESLLRSQRVDEALAECAICQAQAPDNPRTLLCLGMCHYQLGRYAETKQELAEALAGPLSQLGRLEALTALGQIASVEKDFESAARHFGDCLELRPYDSTAAYALGTALSKLGQAAQAEQFLKKSRDLFQQEQRLVDIRRELAHKTDDVPLRLEAAQILTQQGRDADAASWMMSVLRYDPDCREAHEQLAEFFEQHEKSELAQGHREAARASAERPPQIIALPTKG